MVSLVAQVLILAGAGQIQMTLAPDQPFPASYSDDPLIIEFLSPSDTACSVALTITAPDETTQEVDLGSFGLIAGKPRWITVSSLRPFFGPHTVHARITVVAETTEIVAPFHRIERVITPRTIPILVDLNEVSHDTFHVLRTLAVQAVALNPEQLQLLEETGRWSQAEGLNLHLRVGPQDDSLELEGLKSFALSASERVRVWEVEAPKDPEGLYAMSGAIRQAAPGAEIHAVVGDSDALYALLSVAEAGRFEGAVLSDPIASGETLMSLVRGAERAGFEGFPIHVDRGSSSTTDPAGALRDFVDFLSAGASGLRVQGQSVYHEGTIGAAYDVLFAATRILDRCTYLGSLSVAENVRAEVFRAWNRGPGEEEWVAVFWAARGHEATVPLPIESKGDAELLDLYGNALLFDADKSGSVSAVVTDAPVFLRGRGGSVVQKIAGRNVRDQAREFVGQESFLKPLDAETTKALRTLSGYKTGDEVRSEFLTLLRSLPIIEWEWNQGELETSVAVPILARLAEVARSVAVAEQSSKKPFLDPLEKTLAECVRLQGQVRIESGQGRRLGPRVDWLLEEVSRLSMEARRLAHSGRNIEAQAVAALAEWRARCLDVAGGPAYELSRRAPLNTP